MCVERDEYAVSYVRHEQKQEMNVKYRKVGVGTYLNTWTEQKRSPPQIHWTSLTIASATINGTPYSKSQRTGIVVLI